MTQAVATTGNGDVLSSVVIHGDLSKLNEQQKVSYYMQFCNSLGLNPVTQPFAIIKFQGKEVLYAKKDATEQLRNVHGISVTDLTNEVSGGAYVVTCKVKDRKMKTDMATGVVSIDGLRGEALANAMMKAETKAKRRATLSIVGLGMLDESEIGGIPNHETIDIPVEKLQPKQQTLSEGAFMKAMERISKGEKELIQKLRDNYELTEAQVNALLSIEDANLVTS